MEHKLVINLGIADDYKYEGVGYMEFQCECGHLVRVNIESKNGVSPAFSWSVLDTTIRIDQETVAPL